MKTLLFTILMTITSMTYALHVPVPDAKEHKNAPPYYDPMTYGVAYEGILNLYMGASVALRENAKTPGKEYLIKVIPYHTAVIDSLTLLVDDIRARPELYNMFFKEMVFKRETISEMIYYHIADKAEYDKHIKLLANFMFANAEWGQVVEYLKEKESETPKVGI